MELGVCNISEPLTLDWNNRFSVLIQDWDAVEIDSDKIKVRGRVVQNLPLDCPYDVMTNRCAVWKRHDFSISRHAGWVELNVKLKYQSGPADMRRAHAYGPHPWVRTGAHKWLMSSCIDLWYLQLGHRTWTILVQSKVDIPSKILSTFHQCWPVDPLILDI